ncbi:hypothetical protein BJ875DRAFT_466203 [Amylocarpus encephaloides]|uniref:Gfo/Idh/MocA-like oxidoreductase N-terminal domain-containing protein n=1 Tax=Amylocarpus encephaloides TaxID=45428 RepID=A0A9P7YF82_9HELO|nr:hypothetical protein BJ875DRAFT_466203 [Amylocarpus encephaloides]
MSPPIRVAIIGLGRATGGFVPGAWGSQAHLPFLSASPDFEVTAICNSTAASAQESIDYWKLPPTVKAYGSSSDLAQDPNVDIAVVSVNVGKHYILTKPLLEAGKDVFVEWPLGATLAESKALAALANDKGVKTVVGAQSRASPYVKAIRDIVASGEIGDVVSTTASDPFAGLPIGVWIDGADYYLDRNSGGNSLTISFGHFLDAFLHVLGPFAEGQGALSSILNTKFPNLAIVDGNTFAPTGRTVTRTSADHILVQGRLASGALVNLNWHTVPQPFTAEGTSWTITGTKGTIELKGQPVGWQMLTHDQVVVRVKIEGKEAREVELDSKVEVGSGGPGQNTAKTWEAWRKGEESNFPDFVKAVETHEVLERIKKVAGW